MADKANREPAQPVISTAQKKIQKAAAVVTDHHLRLNFLHQAAICIAEQSAITDDACTKLSRNYVREMRELLNSDRVKAEANFTRTFCRKCKQMFVNGRTRRFTLAMTQRKVMQRTCLRCGNVSSFQIGSMKTRNEKAASDEQQQSSMPAS